MSGSAQPRHEPAPPPVSSKNRTVLRVGVAVAFIVIGLIAFVSVNDYNYVNYSIIRPDVTLATISATCTNCYNFSHYAFQQGLFGSQFRGSIGTRYDGTESDIVRSVLGNSTTSWTLTRTNTHRVWEVSWSFYLQGYVFRNGTFILPLGGVLRVTVSLSTGEVVFDGSNESCPLSQLVNSLRCGWVYGSWTTLRTTSTFI